MLFARPLAELIAELERLPGVGPKSAQRLAYHLLGVPRDEAQRLADAILAAKEQLRFCEQCQNISADEVCEVCRDHRREPTVLCVVSEPRDVVALERLNEFKGRYHVLHGELDPMGGIGPDKLRIKELIARLDGVEEVIVATNPTAEGDATALYLSRLIKPSGIKVTRIAHGMPIGGELDYADSATLLSALAYRREL